MTEKNEELKQLKKQLKEANEQYNKVFQAPIGNMSFEAYQRRLDKVSGPMNALDRKIRMLEIVILQDDVDSDDHVMSLSDFIGSCKCGGFIDYDGSGTYVKDGKKTNISIYPSDVEHGAIRKDMDTIVWYNK